MYKNAEIAKHDTNTMLCYIIQVNGQGIKRISW